MKKYIIVGTENCVSYSQWWKEYMDENAWLGFNKIKSFLNKDDELKLFGNICWYQNIFNKEKPKMNLTKSINDIKYKVFDNYDAIYVEKGSDTPNDYYGNIAVPISYFKYINTDEFEIVGISTGKRGDAFVNGDDGRAMLYIDGKKTYPRIIIRRIVKE